jgi:predicted ATPase
MPPWEEIYISDNERYENFEQALAIHNHLEKTYKKLNYSIIEVPIGSINERTDFILNKILL